MNNTPLSPAGISLLGDYTPGETETEEERRRRLAAIEAQKQRANSALSPSGQALAKRGYGLGGISI